MSTCLKMLQFLLFTCSCITICVAHNIDIEVSPILKTRAAGSYFGFSATGVVTSTESWVAVGSPKANATKSSLKNFVNSGALYECPITMDPDCTDITADITVAGKWISKKYYDPSNGWYGVSVVGGRLRDENIMVCAHRPLVEFIRLLGDPSQTLPGLCVVTNKEKRGITDVTKIKDDIFINGFGRGVSYERSQFGETGIGAICSENKECYAAAIGDRAFAGSIVNVGSKKFYGSTNRFAYAGYSLASGPFFTSHNKNGFAIGAPRYNMTGAVLVYEHLVVINNPLKDESNPKVTIMGEQYGSYFGMAVCGGDFDGDGIFEIVVGAPYYTGSINVPSSGKVYVYSHKNNFASPVLTYTASIPQAHALFGKAVAVVGDLDLNGFNDLAVGSPYEDGGVVYIYHGSSDGLSPEPVQTIKASDFPNELKTFGWSLRGETDLDGNGYPDIVVGAYLSDSTMILRSVPVVDVDVTYKLSNPKIDVSNKNCTINDPDFGEIQTVCFDVEVAASYEDRAGKMTNQIELAFELDADTKVKNPEKKRVRFESSRSAHLTIDRHSVENGRETPVVKARAYLRVDQCPECADMISPYPDIELKVASHLPDRPAPPTPPTSGAPPSLEPYFQLPLQLNAAIANFTKTVINITRDCDPCKPDLKIRNVGNTKIPVQAKDIFLQVEISNSADEAYQTTLTIDFPPRLNARPCAEDTECLYFGCIRKNNDTQMVCDLGNLGKIAKNYTIKVDTIKASNTLTTYEVKMNVTSDNKEDASLLYNNHLSLSLKVESQADVAMQVDDYTASTYYSGSVRGQFAMSSLYEIGLKVFHTYAVYNKGPDLVPQVNITIDWPYEAKSGKHLLYLVGIKKNDQVKCFPKPEWVNSLATQFNGRRTRRDVDEDDSKAAPAVQTSQVRKGSSSTIVLDCANGTAMCISIPCTVQNIGKRKRVDIEIESRIWNGTLLEDYTDRDVIVVSRARINSLTSYITDLDEGNHEAEISTSFYPLSPKTTTKKIAVWIIVVSAIAGVVLLIILIVVFKMCGFFNRSGSERYDSVPEK